MASTCALVNVPEIALLVGSIDADEQIGHCRPPCIYYIDVYTTRAYDYQMLTIAETDDFSDIWPKYWMAEEFGDSAHGSHCGRKQEM